MSKSTLKMPKIVHFGDFSKNWILLSISITRQDNFCDEKSKWIVNYELIHFWIEFDWMNHSLVFRNELWLWINSKNKWMVWYGVVLPENNAGLVKCPSADMTPDTPVYWIHLCTSSKYWILPLATTGIFKASTTALMWSQLARPVNAPFCSRVRPCTVRIWQPACSIIWAYLTVLLTSSKIRILQVIGMSKLSWMILTNLVINSQSSCKNEPKWPRLAMIWGQPKLRSMASHSILEDQF